MDYYVNQRAQANGDHEVHAGTCQWIPNNDSRLYVGDHESCAPAVRKAQETYPQSNGCAYCCPDCNTG
jgi:hypothetical protein